jgi:flagellar hook protein FlgE
VSVFSALNTAVSGLTAQSVAFSNISNNISNSQTVGYKAVDTSFSNYVEAAGALEGHGCSTLCNGDHFQQTIDARQCGTVAVLGT